MISLFSIVQDDTRPKLFDAKFSILSIEKTAKVDRFLGDRDLYARREKREYAKMLKRTKFFRWSFISRLLIPRKSSDVLRLSKKKKKKRQTEKKR